MISGAFPGRIDLGRFRIAYEEEQERAANNTAGYLLQQRAIIRLNEDLVKLAEQEDYTVYYDDKNFQKQAGKRPSPLQYFIASIGFCMFSQLKRLALKSQIIIENLEMDLRMTYDLSGSFSLSHLTDGTQGISYIFNLKSQSLLESIIKVAEAADRSCHMVNSMRKRMPVSGRLVLNDREYVIGD